MVRNSKMKCLVNNIPAFSSWPHPGSLGSSDLQRLPPPLLLHLPPPLPQWSPVYVVFPSAWLGQCVLGILSHHHSVPRLQCHHPEDPGHSPRCCVRQAGDCYRAGGGDHGGTLRRHQLGEGADTIFQEMCREGGNKLRWMKRLDTWSLPMYFLFNCISLT